MQNSLTSSQKRELLALLEEKARRESRRKLYTMFPDDGPCARHLYAKHLEFFRAGAKYRERAFVAGNRVGKTEAGAFECALHLTGQYPDWWTGRRYEKPIRLWAAGKTNETTRDIIQEKLLGVVAFNAGRKGFSGTGMIPGDAIGGATWKAGVSDLADTIKVKHVSGGWSMLGLKSYQQGRGSFEGTAQHVIWLDEEPPMDVYGECLIRTATTRGLVMLTFTPLEGLSDTVMSFLPTEYRIDKHA